MPVTLVILDDAGREVVRIGFRNRAAALAYAKSRDIDNFRLRGE